MIRRHLLLLWTAAGQDQPLKHFWSRFCARQTVTRNQLTMDTKSNEVTDDESRRRYKDCITRMNTLQTPAEEIKKLRAEDKIVKRLNRPEIAKVMLQYLARCGITVEEIDRLPVIHITGSKGKGSVCAFSESILRKYNLKTGLLTSPHLVEVRERIRINGVPISYDKYSRYFTEVFDKLEGTKADFDGLMPLYNRMQTTLGFYMFIKEKVDVAVIEVGCGGQYDSTNFVRKTAVAGITSLALEHPKTLGGSLESIAWHKAGIMKPARPAYTVRQPINCMKVIEERAKEIGATICCIPRLEECIPENRTIQLGLAGDHQYTNASLAVQLCRRFLQERKLVSSFTAVTSNVSPPPSKRLKSRNDAGQEDGLTDGSDLGMTSADPFILPEEFLSGLRDCYWPGRTQTVLHGNVTYYLDCAHTTTSIEHCMSWFNKASGREAEGTEGRTVRILLFNMKISKYKPSIFKPLLDGSFDAAVFCPSLIDERDNPAELTFVASDDEERRLESQNVKELFELQQRSLMPLSAVPSSTDRSKDSPNTSEEGQPAESSLPDHTGDHSTQVKQALKCHWFPTIKSALYWATAGRDADLVPPESGAIPPLEDVIAAQRIQVLVTGSIYLVGGVMTLLDPELAGR